MNDEKAARHFADAPMLIRAAAVGGFLRANASFLAAVGYEEAELATAPLLSWLDPVDHGVVMATLAGERESCRVGHRMRDGGWLPLEIRVADNGDAPVVLACSMPPSPRVDVPRDADDEATVRGTLHTIAGIIEDENPGYKCSILLVVDGRFVRGAGPSLPEEYNAAIDGFAVGPTVGSCGTAIYWNVPVIVTDIQADPLWAPFAELAVEAGVAACWSHPFASRDGSVLGALALYAPEPRIPTSEQLSRLRAAARMTGLAVERGRAEEAFRAKRARELELEEQLRQAAKLEAIGVLAGGVAHDFNNVLSTILANAEFARRLLPEGSDVEGMMSSIIDASTRAGQFCQQLLAYAGRGSRARAELEIGRVVTEVGNLVQAAISARTSLDFALHGEPIFVEGDEGQLVQVLMNLVTNAAEAIGDGIGHILVSTEVVECDAEELHSLEPNADLPAGEYVRLVVCDDGRGMDATTAARIFEPFFTTKFSGHGLGLAAVKGIVGQHSGAISIVSAVGCGTTISVLLPTIGAKPDEVSVEPTQTAQEPSRYSILVADDERALLKIIARHLRHVGYEVLEASNGEEAVSLFLENHDAIDCALLDYSMPRMTGEEALRAMRGIRGDLPGVMMSGFSEQEVVDRFHDAGLTRCLQKPVPMAELLAAVEEAIGSA